ncbi:MAG TPA: FGGY family carbohydrate kinase [Puia sp.]|nr:FGGY family carbohydrate kinase [Puia sp.]
MTPVIAILDIGKTNKKLLVFDEEYHLLLEHQQSIPEILDEDGDPCEDLEQLTRFVRTSIDSLAVNKEYDLRAINFAAYGASFVYVDENGKPLTPLYNYLKPYPQGLKDQFYSRYGGEQNFSMQSASPVLGSLNSGMQLYRLKYEQPDIYSRIEWALHLPQYISYLVSGVAVSELTSIGCHTNMWDFMQNKYHRWIEEEGVERILPPIVASDAVNTVEYCGNDIVIGAGLHDSSAALVPYLLNIDQPFVLISTGTWCISLNPFNESPLTGPELQQDCLCYMSTTGRQVKASRLFAGSEHEKQAKKLAAFFDRPPDYFDSLAFEEQYVDVDGNYEEDHLGVYSNYDEAYHRLIGKLVKEQVASTQLVLRNSAASHIFVDGGFGKNDIYMHLLARAFEGYDVYASTVPQASAIGAALTIHKSWNSNPLPASLIRLKKYTSQKQLHS